jgi:hypothetical protein
MRFLFQLIASRKAMIAGLAAIALGGGLGYFQHFALAQGQARTATFDAQWMNRLRAGVGSEVTFATDASRVEASVTSLETFIRERAGATLDPSARKRLIQLETEFLAGKRQALTDESLRQTIRGFAFERFLTLSETDIDTIADTLVGFHWGGDRARPKTIRYFANEGSGRNVTPTEFAERVKKAQSALKALPSSEVTVNALNFCDWDQFEDAFFLNSQAFHQTHAEAKGQHGPVAALLQLYMLASDDRGSDSTANLYERMKTVHWMATQSFPDYPKPTGFRPFGPEGYLMSRPTQYAFNPTALDAFLTRLETATRK